MRNFFPFICSLIYLQVSNSEPSVPSSVQQRISQRRGYLIPLKSQFTLSCPFETPFYKWTRSEAPFQQLDETKNITIFADSVELSGRYQCSAVNGFGNNLAEMAVRIIDFNSGRFGQDCIHKPGGGIDEAGPCFFKNYNDSQLSMTTFAGEDVLLDCSTVTADGRIYQLTYNWQFNKRDNDERQDYPYRLLHKIQTHQNSSITGVNETPGELYTLDDISRYAEAELLLKRVTSNDAGQYKCIVAGPTIDSQSTSTRQLTRTFQIHVIPRPEGALIEGDHIETLRVTVGEDIVHVCRVNTLLHRSATIRWGKSVTDRGPDFVTGDPKDERQHHLEGAEFVALPSISPSRSSATPNIPNPVAVEELGSGESRLVIRKLTHADGRLYICSVVSLSGRSDRKFLRVIVLDRGLSPDHHFSGWNGSPYRLTLYVAAPVAGFFVCLCILSYCLISRRSQRIPPLRHNFGLQKTKPVKSNLPLFYGEKNSNVCVCAKGAFSAIDNGKGASFCSEKVNPYKCTNQDTMHSEVTDSPMFSSPRGSNQLKGQPELPDASGCRSCNRDKYSRNGHSTCESYLLSPYTPMKNSAC